MNHLNSYGHRGKKFTAIFLKIRNRYFSIGSKRRKPTYIWFLITLLYVVFTTASLSHRLAIEINSISFTIKLNQPTLLHSKLPKIKLENDMYSVIFITHKSRAEKIENAIDPIITNNSFLDKVYVYFNDFNTSLPMNEKLFEVFEKYKGKVEIYETIYRDMTARYLLPESLAVRYFLSIDDDFGVEASDANRAFSFYLANNFQGRLVGRYRRTCNSNGYQAGPSRDFNLILTGLTFMDVGLMEAFYRDEYKQFREIAAEKHCEDILMNYVARNATKKMPVYVDIDRKELPFQGMSFQGGHYYTRTDCCLNFSSKFGQINGNGGNYEVKNGQYVRI